MQAMRKRDDEELLTGAAQFDDAYWGGPPMRRKAPAWCGWQDALRCSGCVRFRGQTDDHANDAGQELAIHLDRRLGETASGTVRSTKWSTVWPRYDWGQTVETAHLGHLPDGALALSVR